MAACFTAPSGPSFEKKTTPGFKHGANNTSKMPHRQRNKVRNGRMLMRFCDITVLPHGGIRCRECCFVQSRNSSYFVIVRSETVRLKRSEIHQLRDFCSRSHTYFANGPEHVQAGETA